MDCHTQSTLIVPSLQWNEGLVLNMLDSVQESQGWFAKTSMYLVHCLHRWRMRRPPSMSGTSAASQGTKQGWAKHKKTALSMEAMVAEVKPIKDG